MYIKQIPNLLTISNLLCGVLGINFVLQNNPQAAFICMCIAAVLDFFDGFVARLLQADGELGKQLDSLADAVTFGVLPGFFWYYYMNTYGHCSATGFCINKYVYLFIPAFSIYRLAKFNIDTRQTTGFIGVPTPITALAIASLHFAFASHPWGQWLSGQTRLMVILPLFFGYMLISELPMLALKFQKADKKLPYKITLLLLGLATIIAAPALAGGIIYLLYIVISFISTYFASKHE